MNKPKCTRVLFCCVVLGLGLWLCPAQSQPIQYGSEESITLNIGRDNPFAKIFDDQKTMLREASRLSQSDANAPKLFLDTITLKTLDAESFGPLIEGLRSSYGRISVDKNSNTLIIYDTKEALARIRDIIPQKEIVSENIVHRSYRIVYADIEEVEETLRTFISKNGSLSANPSTSNILVVDFESNVKVIDSFINEVDRITPQILVEARIYDITSKDKLDLGVEWQAGRNTVYNTTSGTGTLGVNPTKDRDPFMTGVFSGATSKTSGTVGALRFGWLNTGIDIDVMLKAQQNIIDAKLLANPRIRVLDNKTASIDIVSQIPYQQLTQSTEGSSSGVGTTAFMPVGVKLEVTPHLARDGMIRLELKPEFSVKVGEVTFESANLTYPQPIVDERKADTTLLVQNGQTVVLGGLRKKEVARQTNKVPLLGDLPLVGLLFKFDGEDTVVSEVVVFVTPWIVEPEEPTKSSDLTSLSETEKQQFEATEFSGPTPVNTKAEDSMIDDK